MDEKHVLEVENESQAIADLVEAKAYTVKQLRQVLFAGSQILPKRIALLLLERKRYAEKFDDLRRVLEDEQQDARTRYAAASALGRLGTPEAREVLRIKLDTKDQYVLRGIHQALEPGTSAARTGKTEMETEPEEGLRWGQRLAAYREGAPGLELSFPAPAQFLPLDLEAAETLSPQPAPSKGMSSMLKQIGRQIGGLSLAQENAVSLRCAGRDLMILLTKDKAGFIKIGELSQRKTIFGIVTVRFGLESQAWSPKYYILTQPGEKQDEAQIMLTTMRGRLAFAGTAQIAGERAEFILRAVIGRGATPAEIRGVYEPGVLRLERVLISQTGVMSQQPRRLSRRT